MSRNSWFREPKDQINIGGPKFTLCQKYSQIQEFQILIDVAVA